MSKIEQQQAGDRADATQRTGEPHLIGCGILSWPSAERSSDRYGVIALFEHPAMDVSIPPRVQGLVEKRGRLFAKVLETRESRHIGDLFHGFYPGGAVLGESYTLGVGTLIYETDPCEAFGLRPDVDREAFWLDPEVLYKLHHQTVDVWFVEEPS